MSYGADESERFKRVAVFVNKILKGTKPADIPVEQPNEIRVHYQSESGQGNRINDSTQRFG